MSLPGEPFVRILSAGSATKNYCYDAAGNLIKRFTTGTTCATASSPDYTYTYDAWGRQTQAVTGGATIVHNIDALGRSIKRTKGSAITTYAFQGLSEQIAAQKTGTSLRFYLMLDLPDVLPDRARGIGGGAPIDESAESSDLQLVSRLLEGAGGSDAPAGSSHP